MSSSAPEFEEIGPPPLSEGMRRLAIGAFSAHTTIAVIGVALSPYLVVNYPLLLVGMSPDIHHIALAAPQVSPLWLLPLGAARRVTVMVAMYAFGAVWGYIAFRWAGRKSARAAQLINFTESLFGRVGLALLVVLPAYGLGIIAGASRSHFWRFLLATTLGQLLGTGLTIFAGDAMQVWVQAILDFLTAHMVEATVIAVVLVVVQQLWSRRQPSIGS